MNPSITFAECEKAKKAGQCISHNGIGIKEVFHEEEIIAVGLTFLFSATVVPAWALFESDRTLSGEATVSMVDAIKMAQKARPGKPVEGTMGKDDRRVVYKIEIV